LKEQLSSLRVVLSALDDKFNERNKETPLKKKTSELSSKLEHKKIS
jgi:predicted nuclease with TOPRIM domain